MRTPSLSGYSLKLTELASDAIEHHVSKADEWCRKPLAEALQDALNAFAADPHPSLHIGRPYRRPVFRFSVKVCDVKHYLQVVYRFSEDEKSIIIIDFGIVLM